MALLLNTQMLFNSSRSYFFIYRNICTNGLLRCSPANEPKPLSPRMREFRKKLRETAPIGSLEEFDQHPNKEQEPLEPYPDNTNPLTGEVGGPKGPEPTRYGDWERKGKVSDF